MPRWELLVDDMPYIDLCKKHAKKYKATDKWKGRLIARRDVYHTPYARDDYFCAACSKKLTREDD